MTIEQTPDAPDLSPRAAPFSSAWREHLDLKLDRVWVEVDRLPPSPDRQLAEHYVARARAAVRRQAAPGPRLVAAWTGADVERAWVSTHGAEVALLRGSPVARAALMLPTVIDECTALLPDKDPRIESLARIRTSDQALDETGQALMADVLGSAYTVSDAQHLQVRSFRNILLGTTLALTVLAILIGVVAGFAPHAFAVCDSAGTTATSSCPTGGRMPSGGDVLLVEILGLAGAAITAATAIRKLEGTRTPFAVPLAVLLLKLPTGAVTALLGILLLRAGFGPDITALTQAQVVAYAVLFGAAQQLFLQFVDKRANAVLDAVGTSGTAGKKT